MNEPAPDIGAFVTRRIHQLLGDNPRELSPHSRAMLAKLRSAAGKTPGTVAAIWEITAEGAPPLHPIDASEAAIHLALTQFALHQQSRETSMHDPHQPFGSAVRSLAEHQKISDKDVLETPIYGRFIALASSTQLPSLVTHSRAIISQLRSQDIAFDYGQFTWDLYLFQRPGRSREVLRRWGLDFHRLTTTTTQDKED